MDRYNRQTPRAAWLDYTAPGAYFITVCTYRRSHYFGKIINGDMRLSPCGMVADACWKNIPNHFPCVELGAFVVMPNHIHGILILPFAGPLQNNNVGMLHATSLRFKTATSLHLKKGNYFQDH